MARFKTEAAFVHRRSVIVTSKTQRLGSTKNVSPSNALGWLYGKAHQTPNEPDRTAKGERLGSTKNVSPSNALGWLYGKAHQTPNEPDRTARNN
ncbi:MAG: hypothetical protein OXG97_08230 [Candidatus Poribacteria bacterium]|nr:hypothetical protein [Candidatus Poribacteria bacterium]